MRADNHGEGGILALLALLQPRAASGHGVRCRWSACSALFGAALLYGDGMITPAISVLSRGRGPRGRHAAASRLSSCRSPWRHPGRAVHDPAARHGADRRACSGRSWWCGSSRIGRARRPRASSGSPQVLAALNPLLRGRLLRATDGTVPSWSLGAVFLAVTGGEALYADMGHFGRRPIRLAWFCLVLPALLLNYFGQGALLLDPSGRRREPVLSPGAGVGAATRWWCSPRSATVIASQALISGAFSLTRQAVQLGYLPRMSIVHTSATEIGQIYIPMVNWMLGLVRAGARARLPVVEQPGLGLRHRGHRHHDRSLPC